MLRWLGRLVREAASPSTSLVPFEATGSALLSAGSSLFRPVFFLKKIPLDAAKTPTPIRGIRRAARATPPQRVRAARALDAVRSAPARRPWLGGP